MEFEEEPCRMRDEDTEEQTDEDGNTVSQTEEIFTQKRAEKTGVKDSFTCSECGKSYSRKQELTKHMRIHTGENLFTCTQCGKDFVDKKGLTRHLMVHTRLKKKQAGGITPGETTDILLERWNSVEVNKDKQHQFQKTYVTNKDGNAIISQTEQNFTQKQAVKTEVKGSFTCTECGKSFSKKGNLAVHMKSHTGEKTFTCTQCGQTFVHKSKLKRHMRIHTGERPYTCTQCGTSFIDKGHLNDHMRIHTGEKPFACTQCGKSFRCNYLLKDHLRSHAGVRSFSCDQCDKTFVVASSLRKHLKIHAAVKPHVCYCGKTFATLSILKTHETIHTGEKPYKCSLCGKSFARSTSLKNHEQVHTGEKPYQCSSCGKSFTKSYSMGLKEDKQHQFEKPHHFKNEDEYAVISQTEQNFTQKQAGKTGAKASFTCTQCGKSFSRKSEVNRHMTVHTGEKPYTCTQCEKGFFDKEELNVHMRIHTGESPFTCIQCGKSFENISKPWILLLPTSLDIVRRSQTHASFWITLSLALIYLFAIV
ncbi:gastrula zinc finger protein XlCGF57.1-like [Sinocyclocheilus rhinocerous]|uniref:gastrula zinc finger protein XlCGF57.1-like n=1 Tax=Sinocyclocheilus rhinocerous TaxID=307959 RepID=UPI0007BA3B73|nr:PREDICTED: gastrula zinc finger protein XlCGF57.1-like [Sinocyclocheilus rhinocerous]